MCLCCWSEDKNTIVADDLMRPAEPWRYESLQKEQEGKDFYFPKISEVEDFYRNGYPAGQAEFRELGRIMMEWGGVRRTGGNGNPGRFGEPCVYGSAAGRKGSEDLSERSLPMRIREEV